MFSVTFSTRKQLLALLLLMFSPTLWAAEGGTKVLITGSVVAKSSCTVNNDNTLLVAFNNVDMEKADGEQLRYPLIPNLICKKPGDEKMMKMIFMGESGFDKDILATSRNNVGIRFYNGADRLSVGEWFKVPNPPSSLKLMASPIIKPGATAEEGFFTATANLLVAIQ